MISSMFPLPVLPAYDAYKNRKQFCGCPLSRCLAQMAMAPTLSTLRSASAPAHIQLVNFGDSVGIGQLRNLNGQVPDVDTEPEAQCWFEIIEGPLVGKRVMCKRWQFSVGDYRVLEPQELRCCEFCKETQVKAGKWSKKFPQCSKCRCYYCSSECQSNDWAAHKLVCANQVRPYGQHILAVAANAE